MMESVKRKTLLLNAGYEPLCVISWKRAIVMSFLNKLEILETYSDDSIPTVNGSFPVPSVVRLLKRIKWRKTAIKFSRENVFIRDNYICQYCHKDFRKRDLTLDHVIPKSKGGRTNWINVVTACRNCNQKKGSKSLEFFARPLLKKPVAPYFVSPCPQSIEPPPTWKIYLGGKNETSL